MKLAVQLYSLREMAADGPSFLALFPQLKAMGFDGVEFAGYHGLGAEEIRKALDDAELVAVGAHVSLEDLMPENLQATIDFHKILGLHCFGPGGAPHSDLEETQETCAMLAEAYEQVQKQGVTIYYHNHASEFAPLEDGTIAIDHIKQACELEVDTYWLDCADVEAYSFLLANKDRVHHVHLKDGEGLTPRALGDGDCDLHSVIKAAKELKLPWLIVEDETLGQGMDSVKKGMAWLKKKLGDAGLN